jgi:hypothetical protein
VNVVAHCACRCRHKKNMDNPLVISLLSPLGTQFIFG